MQLELPLGGDSRLPIIRDRLLVRYGPQRDAERLNATARFVDAFISGDTSDDVSGPAFVKLLTSLRSWDELATYSVANVLRHISEVRHAEQKAINLLAAVHAIINERGHFDLSFLGSMPVDAAFSWLIRFRGVGPKVAAATLNFSDLRMRAMVLDRHGLRIFGCVGILSSKTNFKSGFYKTMPLLPPKWDADDLYELHWQLKMHGQRICRPTQPLCGDCVLSDLCAQASGPPRKFVE
jgi:endonuclease-3